MEHLELSDVIVGLRKELLEAQAKAEKEDLKFKVESIEVEFQVTVSKGAEGGAGIKWKFWIITEGEAKASGKIAKETVQTIRLKLTPEQEHKPLNIATPPTMRPE